MKTVGRLAEPFARPVADFSEGGIPIRLMGKALGLDVWFDASGRAIQISNPREVDIPEGLVYWSRVQPDAEGVLPRAAALVGELGRAKSSVWTLPAESGTGQGFVIVYSLGYQKCLAWGALEPSPTSSSDLDDRD